MLQKLANKVTFNRYVIGLVFIFLLPLIYHTNLIVNGIKTEGRCIRGSGDGTANSILTLIEYYDLHQQKHLIYLTDISFDKGDIVNVSYNPNASEDHLIISFRTLYLNGWGIFCGLLILVWSSTYYASNDDKKERLNIKWIGRD